MKFATILFILLGTLVYFWSTISVPLEAAPPKKPVSNEAKLREQLIVARENAERWKQAAKSNTSVTDAITLSARAYGVPESLMLRRAWCESNHRPGVTNGRYQGLFQFGAELWSITPYENESRYNPLASSLAAAWAQSRGYGSHWSCQ